MLLDVARILEGKRDFMFSFMDRYIFEKIGLSRQEVLETPENFNSVVVFCLETRNRINRQEFRRGRRFLNKRYDEIKSHIYNENWQQLKQIIYSAPGVGQKIGSLLLEVLVHYAENSRYLEKELYVPIDVHVHRVFKECLGLDKIVPPVETAIGRPRFANFQLALDSNLEGEIPKIYFDYLWFVGKAFCGDTNKPRTFKLCEMCWIKDFCIYPDKW